MLVLVADHPASMFSSSPCALREFPSLRNETGRVSRAVRAVGQGQSQGADFLKSCEEGTYMM